MGKDTFYFPHDYNARTDDKIKPLMRTHGLVGYGLYWCIVEDLYNNANAMRLDYDGIAYDLRTKPELVRSIINDFGLFVIDNDKFSSDSIKRRLLERTEKSENARKSANKRWHNADALPTQSEGNAPIPIPNPNPNIPPNPPAGGAAADKPPGGNPPRRNGSWRTSEAGIRAMAVEVGIGDAKPGEDWQAYIRRVADAAEQRSSQAA